MFFFCLAIGWFAGYLRCCPCAFFVLHIFSFLQCDEGLVCFQRQGGETVPGCWGKTDNFIKTDYCIQEAYAAGASDSGGVTDGVTIADAQTTTTTTTTSSQQRRPAGTLNVVGQNGIPASVYPLDLCQGECDKDSDVSRPQICKRSTAIHE